jgi:hypothetical protein
MVSSCKSVGDKMKVEAVAGSMNGQEREEIIEEKSEQKAMTISQSSVILLWQRCHLSHSRSVY